MSSNNHYTIKAEFQNGDYFLDVWELEDNVLEDELIQNILYAFHDGYLACDCNRSLRLADFHGRNVDIDKRKCGSSPDLDLMRLTMIYPNKDELVLFDKEKNIDLYD